VFPGNGQAEFLRCPERTSVVLRVSQRPVESYTKENGRRDGARLVFPAAQ